MGCSQPPERCRGSHPGEAPQGCHGELAVVRRGQIPGRLGVRAIRYLRGGRDMERDRDDSTVSHCAVYHVGRVATLRGGGRRVGES